MGYIYLIKNLKNDKCYVGLSTGLPTKRFMEHFKEANVKDKNNNYAYNNKLVKAIRKYGMFNFSLQILEQCDNKDLDAREIFYISQYDSYKNGYNSTYGGRSFHYDGKYGMKKARVIIEYIKNNPTVTFVEIGKIFSVPASYVSDINCGEIFRFDDEKYPIIDRNNKKLFSKEELNEIIFDLKENKKTLTEIANKNDVTVQAISYINIGKNYHNPEIQYPIREVKYKNKKIKP